MVQKSANFVRSPFHCQSTEAVVAAISILGTLAFCLQVGIRLPEKSPTFHIPKNERQCIRIPLPLLDKEVTYLDSCGDGHLSLWAYCSLMSFFRVFGSFLATSNKGFLSIASRRSARSIFFSSCLALQHHFCALYIMN